MAFIYLADGEKDETRVTFGELERQARAIGGWLQSQGLSGQRALLLFPPGVDFICNFLGCLHAGVVAVPAYPPRMNRKLDRIHSIVTDSRAQVALTTESVLERIQPLLEQTPQLKELKWLAGDRPPAGVEDAWQAPKVETNSLAFLQYTSGSTGTPKGVMLSHGNLLHNCSLIRHAFELTRSGVGVFWLPSYHDMGLVGGILQPLFLGRPNVLMSPMAFLQRPFRWLQAITRYRGTTSGGPNFAYDLCTRKVTPEQRAQLDLSSWTVAFNGAEPVRAETLARFAETFESCGFRREAFYPCYGLAEATLLVSGGIKGENPVVRAFDNKALENGIVLEVPESEEGARRLVGSGAVLPDQEIAIADPETMRRCSAGEVGEIWVSGPSVAQGYWRRGEETQHAFHARLLGSNGHGKTFLRTGDLGFFHEDELFVAGRLKDLIIIRGLNHYPHDIELTTEKSHPAVRPGCGAAFTIETGENPRLVVVYEIERGQQNETEAVFEAIQREVAREHELWIDSIVLIKSGTIPKTSSGKIQRHACKRAFIEGKFEEVARWYSGGSPFSADEASSAASDKPLAEETAEADDPIRLMAQPFGMKPVGGDSLEGEGSLFDDSSPSDSAYLSAAPSKNGHPEGSSVESVRPASVSASDSNARSTAELVLEEVHRIAKERAKGLTLESSIVELGIDSLERMEILNALEERFGGRFPEELLPQLETCRQVVEAVEKHLGQGAEPHQGRGEIPLENYRFDRNPDYLKLKQNLEMLESSGLGNPYFNVHQRVTNDTTLIDGRELINFSSYNYVGMSGDPAVAQAAKEAIDRYGTSVSASRLVSGEKTLHRELERAIADFVGAEDAIVFVGGHSTNESTVGHLFGPGDLIVHDALAHNSIIQGSLLSKAARRPFPHSDWRAVDKILEESRRDYRRVLIAIEGVYSMDGDIPDLPAFIEVKRRHKAFLMVDEAHSMGVLGARGRGIGEHFDVDPRDVDLWMGTLSKSFGSCGGYIAGCKAVVELLKYTAPGFVYSVGISPPNAASSLAAIRILEKEPERVRRAQERARLFLTLAKKRRLNTGLSKDSPVVPVILGNSTHALRLSRALNQRGVNVQPILYPAVEERAARLRFFVTSRHSEEQIRHTVDLIAEELAKISPKYVAGLAAHSAQEAAIRESTSA